MILLLLLLKLSCKQSVAGRSLTYVFLYGLLFIWVFTLMGFAFFRELYEEETGLYCNTLYQCYVTNLHRGLILTLHEVLPLQLHPAPCLLCCPCCVFQFHVCENNQLPQSELNVAKRLIGLNVLLCDCTDCFEKLIPHFSFIRCATYPTTA